MRKRNYDTLLQKSQIGPFVHCGILQTSRASHTVVDNKHPLCSLSFNKATVCFHHEKSINGKYLLFCLSSILFPPYVVLIEDANSTYVSRVSLFGGLIMELVCVCACVCKNALSARPPLACVAWTQCQTQKEHSRKKSANLRRNQSLLQGASRRRRCRVRARRCARAGGACTRVGELQRMTPKGVWSACIHSSDIINTLSRWPIRLQRMDSQAADQRLFPSRPKKRRLTLPCLI